VVDVTTKQTRLQQVLEAGHLAGFTQVTGCGMAPPFVTEGPRSGVNDLECKSELMKLKAELKQMNCFSKKAIKELLDFKRAMEDNTILDEKLKKEADDFLKEIEKIVDLVEASKADIIDNKKDDI